LLGFGAPPANAEQIKTKRIFDPRLGKEVEVVEGEVLVRFKRDVTAERIKQIHRAPGIQTKKGIKQLDSQLVRIPEDKTIEDILETYRQNPDVVFAEPNYIARALSTTPNDPSFSEQWGLAKIYAPEAWDIEKGEPNIIIAILDTGLDLDHPDLKTKIVQGYDFINQDENPQDDHGHGTHVGGIAGAGSNNGLGVTGVAWNCPLMPVKVLDSQGEGSYSDVAEGIIYAADNGAKVINLSLGAYSYSQYLQDAIDYAYMKGCVIIAAAGNDNTNEPIYPAACANVMAVSATDQNDNKAMSSNFGDYIDVAAPGVGVYSTALDDIYSPASGSSAAAPFVSGLAGLILSQDLMLANYEVEQKIKQSADDLGASGRDDYYGYGRINAYNSLNTDQDLVHDLAIIGLEVDPKYLDINQPVTINIIVQNQGDYTEHNIPVEVYVDTVQIEVTKNISSILAGDTSIVNFSWTPVIQEHSILRGQIGLTTGEVNLSNNSYERHIFVEQTETGKIIIKHKINPGVHQWIAGEAFYVAYGNPAKDDHGNDYNNEMYNYIGEPDATYTYTAGHLGTTTQSTLTYDEDKMIIRGSWHEDSGLNSEPNYNPWDEGWPALLEYRL